MSSRRLSDVRRDVTLTKGSLKETRGPLGGTTQAGSRCLHRRRKELAQAELSRSLPLKNAKADEG